MNFSFNQRRTISLLLGISVLSLSSWLVFSLTPKKHSINEKQKILLFKDNDGLYEYDLIQCKKKLICKIADSLLFLESDYILKNDTLIFGTCSGPKNHGRKEIHSELYFTTLLNAKKSWLSSETRYEVLDDRTLNIFTYTIDSQGNSQLTQSTSEPLKSRSYCAGRVSYNRSKPRFYSSSTTQDQSVFSYRGGIYLVSKNDTSLLLENKDGFEPKFGRGNFDPQIHPSKKYVLFNYLPGVFSGKNSELRIINIETKKIHTVKSGSFENPSFSKNGKFILFTRSRQNAKGSNNQLDIFVMDLSNYVETKIGEADQAYWLN